MTEPTIEIAKLIQMLTDTPDEFAKALGIVEGTVKGRKAVARASKSFNQVAEVATSLIEKAE